MDSFGKHNRFRAGTIADSEKTRAQARRSIMSRFMFWFASPIFVIAAMTLSGQSQQVPSELKSRQFMHRKLEHSQKVLEGIVLEDFDLIEKNARTLSLLSQAAEWQILPSAEYKKHGEEFRRTAETLGKAARERNLDGSALAYVQLTLNCVDCHKYVRTFRVQEKPDDGRRLPILKGKDGSQQ